MFKVTYKLGLFFGCWDKKITSPFFKTDDTIWEIKQNHTYV